MAAERTEATTVTIRVKRLGDTRQRLMMAIGGRRFQRILETNLSNLRGIVGARDGP